MSKKIFYFLMAIAVGFSIMIQFVGIHHPLTDIHGFRQTQTAISVYYLIKNGYSLFYETPVFGYPWITPFEFPVYQYVVTFVDKIFKSQLDVTGRVVSLSFYYGLLIIYYQIIKELGFDRRVCFLALLAVIFSPVYLFWSRTFLIESTALFFCLGFALFTLKYLNTTNKKYLFLIFLFCMLGTLTKITSILPSLTFVFLITVYKYKLKIFNPKLLILATVVIISILPAIIYTKYADLYKLQNVYSVYLVSTSKRLIDWNFGTIEQRLSFNTYVRISQFIVQNVGYLIVPFFVSWLLFIKKRSYIQFAALLAYLSGILVFFNLYYIHNYYYYSNSIFGLLFIALEISMWFDKKNYLIGTIVPATILIMFGVFSYYKYYWGPQKTFNNVPVEIGRIIQSNINSNQISIICGSDWSSEIPYYSDRKSIMLTGWDGLKPENLMSVILKSGGINKIGVIVLLNNDKMCYSLEPMFNNLGYSKVIVIDGNKYLLRRVSKGG